jgi:phosphoribosylglycinamide formyltransferase-1
MSFTLGQKVSPLRLAMLISGGGTTLRNFIEKIANRQLDAKIELVISTSDKAAGLKFADAAKIRTLVAPQSKFPTPQQFSEAVFQPCRDAGVHVVAMAGFLKHVLIPADFQHRVTNIHPALIPNFCGAGMYGQRVHEAVLQSGARVTGCTVHFVDDQFDHGPIILQRCVPVLEDDTTENLAARVFATECEAYPEALRMIAKGRIQTDGARVSIAGTAGASIW